MTGRYQQRCPREPRRPAAAAPRRGLFSRGRTAFTAFLLALLVWAVPCAAQARGAETKPPAEAYRATFVAWQRIFNSDSAAIPRAEVRLALPASGMGQDVGDPLFPAGPPDRIAADNFGNRIACWETRNLAPRASFGRCYAVQIALMPRKYDLGPPRPQNALTDGERSAWLADGRFYRVGDPRVAACIAKLPPAEDDATRAREISRFVSERIKYVRDSRWDAAPEVLERGAGSCSEYTFAFIAMARASGIPARYCGGFRVRSPGPFYMDTVAHRWPEAWLEGYGWVALDPTADSGKKAPLTHFGSLAGNLLQTYCGDFSDLLGNDYRGVAWAPDGAKFSGKSCGVFLRGCRAEDVAERLAELLRSLENGAFGEKDAAGLARGDAFVFAALEPMLFSANETATRRAIELCEDFAEPSLARLLETFIEKGPDTPAKIAAAGALARLKVKKAEEAP